MSEPEGGGLSLAAGYAIPVGADGEGPIMRNSAQPAALAVSPDPSVTNLYLAFQHGVSLRPTAPCFKGRLQSLVNVS